eukprot:11920057-Karenia_brevis.AAC.1
MAAQQKATLEKFDECMSTLSTENQLLIQQCQVSITNALAPINQSVQSLVDQNQRHMQLLEINTATVDLLVRQLA